MGPAGLSGWRTARALGLVAPVLVLGALAGCSGERTTAASLQPITEVASTPVGRSDLQRESEETAAEAEVARSAAEAEVARVAAEAEAARVAAEAEAARVAAEEAAAQEAAKVAAEEDALPGFDEEAALMWVEDVVEDITTIDERMA